MNCDASGSCRGPDKSKFRHSSTVVPWKYVYISITTIGDSDIIESLLKFSLQLKLVWPYSA